jgi:hypothetical protein
LASGVASPAAYSGGTGIFLASRNGAIEPLVVPGDLTTDGETILYAFDIRGAGGLMSFRGTTDLHPQPSIFVRTPDGLIRRILGLTDTIEGQIVGYIDSGADDSRVAIRIDTAENPPRHIIYRASFATSLAIPSLSHVGQIGLALILVLAALWALSRRSGVGDEG